MRSGCEPTSNSAVTRYDLSGGAVVELPLETNARMDGAVFTADREGVEGLLPDSLHSVPVTPNRAAVAFVSVEYRRIECAGIEPYGEFLVILPAAVEDEPKAPLFSFFSRRLLGFVWYMPVTTPTARELGRKIWGFPKEVAAISFEDDGGGRRTEVSVDGAEFIRLETARTPTIERAIELPGATVRDGTLLEERLGLDGRLGGLPFGGNTSYTLGDHPRAERLRKIGIGTRALFRFHADTDLVVHPGTPILQA